MKTRKVRKSKVADWRFLTTVVLVMLVVSGHHLLRRADAALSTFGLFEIEVWWELAL